MNDIPPILENQPILLRKNTALGAAAADEGLEAAHFLHAVEFAVSECGAWIALV